MSSDLDWVEGIRQRLKAVDETDRALNEQLLIDSLPAEHITDASKAAADLWDYCVTLPDKYHF